jgi:starch synthase
MTVIRRALRLFADRRLWLKIQENGMGMDFSWEKTAPEYLKLYREILLEDTQHG